MKVALALVAAALNAGAAGACDKKRDRPAPATPAATDDAAPAGGGDVTAEVIDLARVSLETVDVDVPRELYTRELGKQLGLQLTASGAFTSEAMPAPAGAVLRPAALRVTISHDQLERGPEGGPSTVASVAAVVDWLDDGTDPAPSAGVVTHRSLAAAERDNLDGVIAAQVAQTVAAAGDELITLARLRTAPDPELVAALQSPDPDQVVWALELVAARELAAAFDSLVELLDAGVPQVRDGAIAALVALGDPRAVPALADRADFADHELLLRIIDAVGVLGGADAIEFLEFLTSHHDAQIEQRAAGALERLQARDSP